MLDMVNFSKVSLGKNWRGFAVDLGSMREDVFKLPLGHHAATGRVTVVIH